MFCFLLVCSSLYCYETGCSTNKTTAAYVMLFAAKKMHKETFDANLNLKDPPFPPGPFHILPTPLNPTFPILFPKRPYLSVSAPPQTSPSPSEPSFFTDFWSFLK
ncbi:unnamed protein product [Moneuplotes crassus]|uniref:Uncharacterized protein n=1 Tax=Euplotes crassus TaxID=5936 RepID=A0AAD1XE26_EUPCR|nr:unnamed protein product [Moneuplotes crassus]